MMDNLIHNKKYLVKHDKFGDIQYDVVIWHVEKEGILIHPEEGFIILEFDVLDIKPFDEVLEKIGWGEI